MLQIRDVIRAYLPAIVFVVLGVGLGVVFASLNSVLGPKPRHQRKATAEPYESGLPSEVKKTMRFGMDGLLVQVVPPKCGRGGPASRPERLAED